ncbi:MAG TPA: alkaline phosphatase family protein [Actinomycetota bacterium]|nr:alkaline phosphatase family protein [Actinomycetota bacterium]
MPSRAVVAGLDGAAWHLLEPMIEDGVMPRLASLRARGASGRLRSTVPTYTPPAWTSAFTGVNPGRHGVYGFVEGHAQSERAELVHSGKVRAPTVWRVANAQDARAGVYNVPLTYPPQGLDGWMVSGMMTPGYGERLEGFAARGPDGVSPGLERDIQRWAPGYVVDVSANYEQDWRDEALCRRALASIRQRRTVLERLLESDPVDVVFAVLEAPDRLQHVYYRYMDPRDELFDTPAARAIRPHVHECFAAMDEIVGALEDYAGVDGGVLVCSDHGFTAWEVSVHVNALLERWGYLALRRGARALQSGAVRKLVPLAKRVLPRKLARDAKGRTFAAIDWGRTRAFASPIPQQGVFVNVRGRERFGIVPPDELAAVKDDLVARFEALTGPDGRRVADRVWRSEDVFEGDALDGAPDVLPVLAGHRYELDDELFHREPFTDVSTMPRGVHHPDGIVVVAGAGARAGARLDAHVTDVMPTLLYQAGLAVPEGLDGAVIDAAFEPEWRADRPVRTVAPLSSAETSDVSPYSADEEAIIEESLRGLGYL